jgi:hypothetical protein
MGHSLIDRPTNGSRGVKGLRPAAPAGPKVLTKASKRSDIFWQKQRLVVGAGLFPKRGKQPQSNLHGFGFDDLQ